MNILFIGPQGSGKGTQAKIVSEKLGIPHVSTGDLLRDIRGGLKKEVESYINHGKLVPDELILRILNERILKSDCDEGFILDGFPRNLRQVKLLEDIMDVDKVIEIHISDEVAMNRVSGRRNCKSCGAIYNVETNPKPKNESICDKCGGELFQRNDDTEKAVTKRLKIYHKETEPILEKYDSVRIDGEQDIDKVTQDLLKVL